MTKIYFHDKPLFITDSITPAIDEYLHHEETVFIDEFNSHTVKAMIHEMLSQKILAGVFLHQDTGSVLNTFKKKFAFIRAAGGFVFTKEHEVLMIFRRGKWDLPKGKLDENEDLETCALREVSEETGVNNLQSKGKLCTTYHTYFQEGKQWLKESHWYMITTEKTDSFTPQVDEEIEKCEWVNINQLAPYTENTHPSIIDVLNAGLERLKETKNV